MIINRSLLCKFQYLIPASSGLTEDQAAVQKLATDFALNEMRPNMAKWDQEVSELHIKRNAIADQLVSLATLSC